MIKIKHIIMVIIVGFFLLLLPNMSNAAVTATRNIYSNNGSMTFTFSGLELNTSHIYEFGLTQTVADQVKNWHQITNLTASTAVIDITTATSDLMDVIKLTDNGYITIRDKTDSEKEILQDYAVDLKLPFLSVTNYSVIPNGKQFGDSDFVQCPFDNKISINSAYYQYEKITDESIISKYREIKEKNGDFNNLQSLLKNTPPSSNWTSWDFRVGKTGYPQRNVSVPESGLYYMWLYFSGNNLKNIYGYILVDNLQPEIALENISLSKTAEVELGKTLKLTPTFTPGNATNKIVTWSSSDESVATVDNSGTITPKKIGSTIITVTSQDGTKKATCTVTVVQKSNSSSTGGTNNKGTSTGNDKTVASGILPQTGIGIGLIISLIIIIGISIFSYIKSRKYRDI